MDDERTDGDRNGVGRAGDGEERPPLEDLAERIRGKVAPADSEGPDVLDEPDVDTDALFTEEEPAPIDIDAIWQSIESDWPGEDDTLGFDDTDAEHVVSKRWFCEQCEYFSNPPEVRCSHEGTTILEFVGTEEVRVRNCPIVAERLALGHYSGPEIQPSNPD